MVNFFPSSSWFWFSSWRMLFVHNQLAGWGVSFICEYNVDHRWGWAEKSGLLSANWANTGRTMEPHTFYIDKIAYLHFKGQTQLLCRTLFMFFREDTLGALVQYLNHIKAFFFKNSFFTFQFQLTYNTILISGVHPNDQTLYNLLSDHNSWMAMCFNFFRWLLRTKDEIF